MFSLKNKDNLPPFKALVKNPNKAIFADVNSGPNFGNFGNMPDLHISTKKCYSYFGYTYMYNRPERYRQRVNVCDTLLAGASEFTPSEIEVFY